MKTRMCILFHMESTFSGDVWAREALKEWELSERMSWSIKHFLSVSVLSKIRFLMLLSDNYAIHLKKALQK